MTPRIIIDPGKRSGQPCVRGLRTLLDENPSRKLVARLAESYPESADVAQFGLPASPDREVWEFAKASNFVIVSTRLGLLRTSHKRLEPISPATRGYTRATSQY
jgi:uncharacterized protein (DUF433 family)